MAAGHLQKSQRRHFRDTMSDLSESEREQVLEKRAKQTDDLGLVCRAILDLERENNE
jgi:uncharacterized membrane protein